jgi:hypothetical protein
MRRRPWSRGLPALAACTLLASSAAAQALPLNAGALFLEFPVGARAVGMGQATMADGGRGEAAFWNPAGLALLVSSAFELHTATLPVGRAHAVTAYFPSSRVGVIGAAVYLVDYGDQPVVDTFQNVIGRAAFRNYELLASYATSLPGPFAVGLSYKLIGFLADCSGACADFPSGEGVTHALDLGGQFTIGAPGVVTVGIALRNLGFRLQVENADQADPLPTRLAIGALWITPLGHTVGDEAPRVDLRLAADVDRPWGVNGSTELRLGIDLGYRELARIRAGYGWVPSGTTGASIGLGVVTGSIGVDLAQTFLSASELEAENPTYFSFRVLF